MQISKKGKSLNYQTCLVSGGQDTALTGNCWEATCGCKNKAPSSEKRKQKRNSRKMNASECNLKVTKRKKTKCLLPALPKKQRRSKQLKNTDSPKSIEKQESFHK